MIVFGIVLCAVSVIFLFVSVVFFLLYCIFEYKPDKLGKATATLKYTKHRKDVPVYGRNSTFGPIRVVMIIKNWSKSLYEYKVNDKTHKIHYIEYVTSRQMPFVVQVIYLKKIPRIAYVKTDTNFHNFEIYSFVALMSAILFALCGISLIF